MELSNSRPAPADPLQAAWLALMRERLPAAAALHPEWPIRLDHCFGRVILDAVVGRPWREVLPSPAWRSLNPAQLRAAITLGEAILDGDADLQALNARSLQMRRASRAAARAC